MPPSPDRPTDEQLVAASVAAAEAHGRRCRCQLIVYEAWLNADGGTWTALSVPMGDRRRYYCGGGSERHRPPT